MDKKCLYLLLFTLCLINGCAEPKVVEELGFIHSIGYELNEERESEEDGWLIMTITIPQILMTAKEDSEVLSIIAHSGKDGKYKLARKSDRLLVSGQKRTALFSMNLAQKGVMDIIDTLSRDPTIGLNLKVIVVNGSSKEILESEYPQHPRTGRYIFEMVEKESEIKANADTILHQFIRDYYDDGIDPMAAVIKKGKEEIILDGIALFQDDRYVMKVDPKDSRVFMMLHGAYKGGNIMVKLDLQENENVFATFNTLETKRKIKVNQQSDEKLAVNIKLDVKGSVEEFTGTLDLSEDKNQTQVEEALAEHIEKVSRKLFEQMQEKNIDNIGIGQYVRNRIGFRKWESMDWREVYPNIDINVEVDVKLRGFGTIK